MGAGKRLMKAADRLRWSRTPGRGWGGYLWVGRMTGTGASLPSVLPLGAVRPARQVPQS